MSLLDFYILLWMALPFGSTPTKSSSMVTVSFASLLYKSEILFLFVSVTPLPFVPVFKTSLKTHLYK